MKALQAKVVFLETANDQYQAENNELKQLVEDQQVQIAALDAQPECTNDTQRVS